MVLQLISFTNCLIKRRPLKCCNYKGFPHCQRILANLFVSYVHVCSVQLMKVHETTILILEDCWSVRSHRKLTCSLLPQGYDEVGIEEEGLHPLLEEEIIRVQDLYGSNAIDSRLDILMYTLSKGFGCIPFVCVICKVQGVLTVWIIRVYSWEAALFC